MSINPQSAHACLDRGLVRRKRDELDRGILDHDRAMSGSPRYAPVHLDRGLAWSKKDELDRAIADLDGPGAGPCGDT